MTRDFGTGFRHLRRYAPKPPHLHPALRRAARRNMPTKVLEAVERGAVPEAAIDAACRRVLTWKQNLHLLPAL